MHEASAEAKDPLKAFAAGHEERNAEIREGLLPKASTDAAFEKLDWLLIAYYDLAGEHLRAVWPRPSELDRTGDAPPSHGV